MENKTTDRKTKIKPKSGPIEDVSFAGKMPPQALDLEEAVLGAMMLQKDALLNVIDILHPDVFYADKNREVYAAIRRLFDVNEPIDMLTVSQELRKAGMLDFVGGSYYITRLTTRVASAANIEFHARIITQKFIMRELIRFGGEVMRDAYDEGMDTLELLDRAQQQLFNVGETNIKRNVKSLDAVLKQTLAIIEKAKNHENTLTGIPSGISDLDNVTNGWQKQDLVIIAARPGMGKTAFVLSIARNAAVQFQKSVAFFSLEMSNTQIATRLLSSEAEINQEHLRTGNLHSADWTRIINMSARLEKSPLYVDDTPALSVFELKAKARRLKQQKNIELIIVDYLQLMRGEDNRGQGNREQEISYISRSLKTLAKELDIPVIALAQLSRAVETRGSKDGGQRMPILSDLRESGSIEQDADMVIFLYRPEYYRLAEYIDEDQNNAPISTTNLALINIAKHRNGKLDIVKAKFEGAYTRFSSYENDMPDALSSNTITVQSKMNDEHDDFDGPKPF